MMEKQKAEGVKKLIELQRRFIRTLGDAIQQDNPMPQARQVFGAEAKSSAEEKLGILSRADLETSIHGPLAAVLGPAFKELDKRRCRLRLPAPPFLFVSRVLRLEGEKLGLGQGLIEWEFTIPSGVCLSDGQEVSPALLVESNHAVLLLLSYLGYDNCLGEFGRFRALTNSSSFTCGTIKVGSTYRAITVMDRVVRTREQVLFNLKTEGFLDDAPVLSSSWQAGIFHVDFLDRRHAEMPFHPLPRLTPVEPIGSIPSSLNLIDQVLAFEAAGGPHGLGEMWLKLQIKTMAWVLDCHFVNDPVYPGILAIEAAFQGLMLLALKKSIIPDLRAMQWGLRSESLVSRFMGEIRQEHGELLLQIHLVRFAAGDEPMVQALARIYCDGHLIGEVKGLSLDFRKPYPVTMNLSESMDLAKFTAPIPIDEEHAQELSQCLEQFSQSFAIVRDKNQLALARSDQRLDAWERVGEIAPLEPSEFGSAQFRKIFGLQYAYMIGGMAHGISSEELVICAARAGILASFGAAGLQLEHVLAAVDRIKEAIPSRPFVVNFIHQPADSANEWALAKALISRSVKLIEASAFVRPSPALVYYRCAGLGIDPGGKITAGNRIIAKISRPEVASFFLKPAPESILKELLRSGHISPEQALYARRIPLVDALTVEADSGGHTDNRPLTSVFPIIQNLLWDMVRKKEVNHPVLLGVGGGIGCPEAVHAAFSLGAAYIVTGSINQATVEARTSLAVKEALAAAGLGDMAMAPSADMFEMGAKVQVLRGRSIFALRAQKLQQFYLTYKSIEELMAVEGEFMKSLWRKPWEAVWSETEKFWERRNPAQLAAAMKDDRIKMALMFRWYLGKSVLWALDGDAERSEDYQIWCGPAMGACNQWLKGSPMEPIAARHVDKLARHLLGAAAFHQRCLSLQKFMESVRPGLSYSFGGLGG